MRIVKRVICLILFLAIISGFGIMAYAEYEPNAGSGNSGLYIEVWAYFHKDLSYINGNLITRSYVRLIEGAYDSKRVYDVEWNTIYQGRRAYVSKLNDLLKTSTAYWGFVN